MTGFDAGEFRRTGAARFDAALGPDEIARVGSLFGEGHRPGARLGAEALVPVHDLIGPNGLIGGLATRLLGSGARPVRALLLDKSADMNWRLGWHQDRTIAVRRKIDMPGFATWSVKAGQLHVQPPHEITRRMVTLRVHVYRVDEANAPLEVLLGSHGRGRLSNRAVDELAQSAERLICLADAGDVWAYSTAIVHASAAQRRRGRRRVLQIDYSADLLPGGLEWVSLI